MGEIKYDIVPTGGEGRGELRGRPSSTRGRPLPTAESGPVHDHGED
ncbi:hypothetical protein [Streptomyces pseudovenezuelae]|nr:hypothetical protein [Streptomyces pseudovenezuelae]